MDDKEHRLEYKIGDRIYQLICSKESPIHEVAEALHMFQGHIMGMIKNYFSPPEKVEVKEDKPEGSDG